MEKTICPKKAGCSLFAEVDLLSALIRNIETFYCKRSFEKCARYKLYQEGKPVPPKLLPHDKECLQCEIKGCK